MKEIKVIVKLILKNYFSFFISLMLLMEIILCFLCSVVYVLTKEDDILTTYVSVFSFEPIIFSLFIYSLFKDGKMIIFRSKYKISFKRIIFTMNLLVCGAIIIANIPFVYSFLNQKNSMILFPFYIIVFALSINLFSVYFVLFFKNKKIAFFLLTVLIQIILCANSLVNINIYEAKLIVDHFSIIGILSAKKVDWIYYILILSIPPTLMFFIDIFQMRIDWSFPGV